jgi:uncharacterized repeat protein (TIGR01451 family)
MMNKLFKRVFTAGVVFFLVITAAYANATNVDLGVSSYTWSPDPVIHSGTSTFSITVTNNDNFNTASGLTLAVSLPSNVDFSTGVTASSLPTGCTLDGTYSTLTCANASLSALGTWVTTFNGVGKTPGAQTTTATISASGNSDPNAGNDSLTKNTTVISGADLSVAVTGVAGCTTTTPCSTAAGSNYSFYVTVNNNGPDAATTFRVVDNLPATVDFTYSSAIGSGWSCSVSGTTVTCDYSGSSIPSGNSAPAITITGQVITSAGTITDGASVTSTDGNTGDPVSSNNGPAQVVVTVTPGTNLQANKTMKSASTGLTTFSAGESVTLTLSATNSGTQQATGVTLTDTISSNFTIGTLPLGCTAISQTITCTVGTLNAATTSSVFTIPLTVIASPTLGNGSNTAAIGRSTPAGGANNPGSASYTISPPFAHLTLSKSKTPTPVSTSGTITSTITVTNSNSSTSAATGIITVTDTLGANEVFVSNTDGVWACAASGTPQVITCTYNLGAGSLARGASLPNIVIQTTPTGVALDSPVNLTNTACTGNSISTAQSPLDNVASTCVSKTVIASQNSVDLSMNKVTSSTHLLTTDSSFTYTLTISNTGPNTAPTVNVSDAIPMWYSGSAGTTGGSAVITSATAGESCNFASTVTCALLNIASGTSRTITITLNRPLKDGTFTNTATVSTPDSVDSNLANNSGSAPSVIVDPIADVTVTNIADAPHPVKVGVQMTYTTSIKNNGPSTAAGVVVYHTIDPTRMTYVAGTASITGGGGASCSYATSFASGPYAGQAGIQCSGFSMANGESRQLTFSVIPVYPYPDAFPANYISNAAISTTTTESNNANNTASNTAQVIIQALDLSVTDNDTGYDPVAFGDAIVYTVKAQNNGPSQATGLTLSVMPNVPSGGTPSSYTLLFNSVVSAPSGSTCSQPGGAGTSVFCYLGSDAAHSTMAANSSATFQLKFDTGPIADAPPSSITYSSTATVSSQETIAGYDTQPSNNTVTETTTALPKTDLAVISKAVSKSPNSINEPFTYTIVVGNYGPSTASGVQVTDVLPAGLVVNGTISITAGSAFTLTTKNCTSSGSPVTVSCSLGTLPVASGAADSNNLATITIPVKAPYPSYTGPFGSNLSNTATIAPLPGTSLDPTSANNTSNTVNVQIQKSSISGYVYTDNNRNDVMDSNSSEGIGGVTLTLSGTDDFGNSISKTVTTTSSPATSLGNFIFDNLPPADTSGGYAIVETQPGSYYDRNETAGTSGGSVNNATYDANPAENTIGAISLAANTAATGYIFQEYKQGIVSGYVYSDLNNDGQRALSGEVGISSIAIKLTGTDYTGATVNLNTITNASGFYTFSAPPSQTSTNYTVTEQSQPSNYYDGLEQNGAGNVVSGSSGRQLPGAATTESIVIGQVDPSGSYTERDFGELAISSLAGSVFIDSNSDAVRQAGETGGVPNVTVTLSGTDYLGHNVCTTYPAQIPTCTFITDGSGNYSIANLPPGIYTLTETPPTGLTHTGAQAGSVGGTGGLGVGVTSVTNITLSANTTATGYNFGESGQVLSGFVYVDTNGNGVKDSGEPGISGVSITLSGVTAGGVNVCTAIAPNPCTAVTGADGGYNYLNIPASNAAGYTLTEQPQATAPLSNYGDGAESVGTVNGTQTGSSVVNDQFGGIVIGVGQSGINYNFGELGSSLAGTVYIDANGNGSKDSTEAGLAGVTVTLSGNSTSGTNICSLIASCTTTTTSSGTYGFTGLPSGSYTLTETQPVAYGDGKESAGTPAGTVNNSSFGSTAATNQIQSVPLLPHQNGIGYDFGEHTGTISGIVYNDLNANGLLDSGEPGISGVIVKLTGTDILGNPVSLTTTTAADGSYSFTNLLTANGSGYTVTETPPTGWMNGITAQGKEDGATCSGCNDATATKIQAIPFQPDHTFTSFNFGHVQGTSISGHVYHDANNNSVLDGGEALAGVTITLTGTDDLGATVNLTTTTLSDGSYSFANLRPSSAAGYMVTETQPAGMGDFSGNTGTVVGSAGGSAALNVTSGIVLGSGVAGSGYDFRENASSLAGYVYLDANNNGVMDAGEVGIPGVPLTLSCVGGGCTNVCAMTTCSAISAADGSYKFIGLTSGTYAIVETQPSIYQDGLETAGTLGGTVNNSAFNSSVANNSITNISVGVSAPGTGYLFGERAGLGASVSGKAWLNTISHDTVQQTGEPGLAGWIVQLVRNGSIVASTITSTDGSYSFTGVTPNTGYGIVFRNPTNNAVYGSAVSSEPGVVLSSGTIQNLTIYSGANIINQNLPVDPSGVVYNSVTRNPVLGATVTITGPPGFDPATQLVGGSSAQSQVTGADGFYQFLLTGSAPVGTYTIAVTTYPAGYLPAVSAIIPPTAGPLNPGAGPAPYLVQVQSQAPTGGQSTVYYLTLTLGSGKANVINNHIPLDPILGGAIVMTKTSPKVNVSRGDLVPYTITATNTLSANLTNIDVHDMVPPGFKYKIGSAAVDGIPKEPMVNGRDLTWKNVSFAPKQMHTIHLMLVIGSGVSEGEYVNSAYALNDLIGASVSNTATATVRVVPDPTFDCSDLIGKVFDDKNANGYQDEGEPGIPNVRLATVNGLLVTTDAEGRFHVTCAMVPNEWRGSNFIMKLDERTLPTGYRLTTENPRDVRLTSGKMAKINFGATIHRVVRLDVSDTAFDGDALKPEWQAQLEKMPEMLKERPMVLRLAYKEGADGAVMAKRRLQALSAQLRVKWQEKTCCHLLQIEEELIQPSQGKREGQ